jgi:hypothetical protein
MGGKKGVESAVDGAIRVFKRVERGASQGKLYTLLNN